MWEISFHSFHVAAVMASLSLSDVTVIKTNLHLHEVKWFVWPSYCNKSFFRSLHTTKHLKSPADICKPSGKKRGVKSSKTVCYGFEWLIFFLFRLHWEERISYNWKMHSQDFVTVLCNELWESLSSYHHLEPGVTLNILDLICHFWPYVNKCL